MFTFNVGGVPEHFNTPWKLTAEKNPDIFNRYQLKWVDYPGGTGDLLNALDSGALDIAVLLTEGAVKGITSGLNSKIVRFYVISPLRWGIHTKKDAGIEFPRGMQGRKYAVSRLNSGSHLMSFVNAENHNLKIDDRDFEIVGNINGAREALQSGAADLFLWERYTTEPYVQSADFERIGECPTPWPSFVVAARDEVIERHEVELSEILDDVFLRAAQLKGNPGFAVPLIARQFNLDIHHTTEWFNAVEWNTKNIENDQALLKTLEVLRRLGIIQSQPAANELNRIRHYVKSLHCA